MHEATLAITDRCVTENGRERLYVTLEGELDVYTTPRLKAYLDRTLSEGSVNLTVDLTGLTLCQATGIGRLIVHYRNLIQRDGDMLLVLPETGQVRRTFEITGVDKVIPTVVRGAECASIAEKK